MRIWVLLALLLVDRISHGATVPGPSSFDVLLSQASFSEKLTQQTVSQSFQDSRGVLWFVTQEGLNRYNGYKLENYIYSASNPNSLPANIVTRITEDLDGQLWISTLGGGLARYNPISNDFDSIKADPNNRNTPYSNDIYTIYSDSRGTLWLGYINGFSTFDPKHGDFHHYISGNGDIPFMGEINGFTETSDGKIWAATQSGGVLEIDPSNQIVHSHVHSPVISDSIVAGPLYHITTDNDENIWISSANSGVSRINPHNGRVTNFVEDPTDVNSLSSNQTLDVFEDSEGDIWVATAEGLSVYVKEKEHFQRYGTHNTNIPEDRTVSVYQTREGMVWVGTLTGLASGFKTHFKKYTQTQGNLSGQSVNAFEETYDNSLWVATDDGLNRLRPGKAEFEWINESTLPSISSPVVMSLLSDERHLWIGTYNNGLNKLNLMTNEVQSFQHSPFDESSIGGNGITSILRTTDGQLLIGTYGGGLSIFDEQSLTFKNLRNNRLDPSSITDNKVLDLFEDSTGLIWIGTENGLNLFYPKTQTFRQFTQNKSDPNSLPSNIIWKVHEDRDGNLWLGTSGGGLIKWPVEDKSALRPRFVRISDEVTLPSSSIYGVLQDQTGWLWLSHNKGLTRLDPKSYEAHQYGVQDGLQASEFNLGASFKSSDGTLYFGGINGFNAIRPNEISLQRTPPKVSISEIRVMNQRREFDAPYYALEAIKLGYEDRMLSVEFFAADYSNPDQLNYAYMLEGINPDWVVSPDSRTASFTTLPPGKYHLKLAAASPDGTWNWNARTIPIVVAPPPWRSPAAYALYAVFAIALIAYYFYRQHRRAQASLEIQRELESRVEMRTRDLEEARKVAEEATRAKSDFLATMSHEIRTPMHGIIGMTELLLHTNLSGQQRQFATAAHNSGESLLSLINEILDFSKAEASKVELEEVEFNLVELIDDICYLQGEPASRKGLDLNNICDPDTPENLIGDPTKIRQVVMNLVSNSIKFTQHGNVNVRVKPKFSQATPDKAIVHICVEDDGIGMDAATQEKVFEPFTQADTSTTREYGGTGLGLSISRHYIELMGGDISVKSEKGQGTKITILVPLAISPNQTIKTPVSDSLVARIYSTNPATFEMIESHLTRLGATTARITERDLNKSSDYNNDLVLIDYRKGELGPATIQLVSKLKAAIRIALTPLDGKLPAEFAKNWSRLTKPVTSKVLQELLTKSSAPLESVRRTPRGAEREKPATRRPTHRILVAEDVETNQRIIKEMLHLLGYEVDIANNGQEALDKYKDGEYALLFMDCQMPILDGYAATKEIRAHEKAIGLNPTPIIALTAGSDDEDKKRCKNAGMNDYIKKPFSISDIKLHITSIVSSGGLPLEKADPRYDEDLKNHQHDESITASLDDKGASEIFNYSAINSIRDVEQQTGRPLLHSLFEGYKNQMAEKLEELQGNIDEKNGEALYRTAHAIKSMSANIGAEKVRLVSSELEKMGRRTDLNDAKNHFELLTEAYDEFIDEFGVLMVGQRAH